MNAPLEWRTTDPHVQIPEWGPLGCASMAPSALSRHVFIVGETGSGKTRSGVVPVLNGLLRYPGPAKGDAGLSPSMLVIDPKNELASVVRDARPDKTISLEQGTRARRVWLYEGVDVRSATAADLLARLDNWVSARRPISHHGNSLFFDQAELRIRTGLLDVDRQVFVRDGPEGVTAFWAALSAGLGALMGNALGDTPLQHENYFKAHARLVSALMGPCRKDVATAYVTLAESFQALGQGVDAVRDLVTMADETLTSIGCSCQNSFETATDSGLTTSVQTSPFLAPPADERVSILDVLNDGWAVTYAPSDRSQAATAIGRVLKGLFFELSMRRNNRERPVLYVCDEFQRFITNDLVSGEQSFLDRCRAYRVICVLATQSEASIRFALAADGESGSDGYAIDILLNNTGTKLFFRSTDVATKGRLGELLPAPYTGTAHIVDVRPPATLAVGECYYLLSDGSWGRARVDLGGAT